MTIVIKSEFGDKNELYEVCKNIRIEGFVVCCTEDIN